MTYYCDFLCYIRYPFWLLTFDIHFPAVLRAFSEEYYLANTISYLLWSVASIYFVIRFLVFYFFFFLLPLIFTCWFDKFFYYVREWFILLSVNSDFILLHLSLFTSIKCWLYLLHCYLVFIMVFYAWPFWRVLLLSFVFYPVSLRFRFRFCSFYLYLSLSLYRSFTRSRSLDFCCRRRCNCSEE